MTAHSPLFTSYCDAYADAVVMHLRLKRPVAVFYSETDKAYAATAIEPGTSGTDVSTLVGQTWKDVVGELSCPTDPEAKGFSFGQLRKAVYDKLLTSEPVRKLSEHLADPDAY
jgi:hypothetical protein